MIEFDDGPSQTFAGQFAAVPDYGALKSYFWYEWGPIFYRGRTDGSAKVLCVAQDPGATERIAGRTLVGDAGQRVQGFLNKIGLVRSYLCLNVYSFAMFPSQASAGKRLITVPEHLAWRNALFDMAKSPQLEAIIAFGVHAQKAVKLWPGRDAIPVVSIPHPSSRDETALLNAWRDAVVTLRAIVTPDPGAAADLPNYGAAFSEADYSAIPRADLPYGVPDFLGDDSVGRSADSAQRSSVTRPNPDDRRTLIWKAPRT
ncbi:MAG: uracil-DNA glycosylase family protein [Burkholderiaceae bacterium]